jgi:magnesium chelatase family protein
MCQGRPDVRPAHRRRHAHDVRSHPPARAGDAKGLDHRTLLFGGELSLDGRVRPIRGAIASPPSPRPAAKGVVVAADNAVEAAVVEGVEVHGVRTLAEVVGLLNGEIEPTPVPCADVAGLLLNAVAPVDFADVRGQEGVKLAIVVAAAVRTTCSCSDRPAPARR